MSLISIETTRYSTVVRKFVEHYPGETKLDRKLVHEPIDAWCTNSRLQSAINFSLVHGGNEVLSFHDGPRNMWAHEATLPFVESLAKERYLRFSVSASPQPSRFQRFLRRVFGT